jgi:hypothetical protein
MSRNLIEAPVSDEVRAAVSSGWAAYEAATRETGPTDEWDKRVIDEVIRAFAAQGRPFGANDIRKQLPAGVNPKWISKRFIAAQREGLVRYVGITPSSLKSTKSARVNVYAPIQGALT